MAIGTETIPKVNFICGPGEPCSCPQYCGFLCVQSLIEASSISMKGNAFVATAKAMLYGEIGIDLFAGPTEVLIVADEDASPFMCAVDLLSQAEHGPDTPAVLVTNSERVGRETIEHVEKILTSTNMSTAELASISWKAFGEVVVTESMDEAYTVADAYASEHVQILTKSPRDALTKMSNYGALFLGARTCVSFGDKVSKDPSGR